MKMEPYTKSLGSFLKERQDQAKRLAVFSLAVLLSHPCYAIQMLGPETGAPASKTIV